MNSINLVGRITKDLELKCTPSGKYVCEFSLAVNRVGEGADFINCQVWNAQAENLAKYQSKGGLIGVVGSLRTETYEVEGTKRYKTFVLANNIEYLSSKSDKETSNEPTSEPNKLNDDVFADFGTQIEISDEDLAF